MYKAAQREVKRSTLDLVGVSSTSELAAAGRVVTNSRRGLDLTGATTGGYGEASGVGLPPEARTVVVPVGRGALLVRRGDTEVPPLARAPGACSSAGAFVIGEASSDECCGIH